MTNNYYYIVKNSSKYDIMYIDRNKLLGFDITPKNRISYDGIVVNKLVIIKKAFIEKILKRKIKRKLELYLQFIIDYIDGDNTEGGTLSEILNDITRYRDIINYRYRKHLGDKYIDLLLKKINLLEYELKVKVYAMEEKKNSLGEENIGSKSR